MHTCDMTHAYAWHDNVWHDPCIHVTWLMHTYDMTHTYVWHGLCIGVSHILHDASMRWHRCLVHTWDRTNSCMYMCDVNRLWVLHWSFIRVTWLVQTCVCLRTEQLRPVRHHLFMGETDSFIRCDFAQINTVSSPGSPDKQTFYNSTVTAARASSASSILQRRTPMTVPRNVHIYIYVCVSVCVCVCVYICM